MQAGGALPFGVRIFKYRSCRHLIIRKSAPCLLANTALQRCLIIRQMS